MKIKLVKIEELPDALHKNNIEVGLSKKGDFVSKPKIGECFWVGNGWRTSIVKEIIDANTFRTCNSVYRWSFEKGIDLIAEERQRQIDVEGWSAKHDAKHIDGSLAKAAACYAMPIDERENYQSLQVQPIRRWFPRWWPKSWSLDWWKPTPEDRIRELVKAGSLIAAEIDRLLYCPQVCESCSKEFDLNSMMKDDADNYFCEECWNELSPVMKSDYDQLVKNGEVEP